MNVNQSLARAIAQLHPSVDFESQLDELLIWINKGAPDGELTHSLAQRGIDKREGLRRALLLLDRHLFEVAHAPHRQLGLRPEASVNTFRLRYRRLVLAFHPDRQPGQKEWLTDRTERLNAAYAAIKNKTEQASPEPPKTNTQTAYKSAAPRIRPSDIPLSTVVGVKIRTLLGGGDSFQHRFFFVLLGVCSLFLLYLYYLNRQNDPLTAAVKPTPVAIVPAIEKTPPEQPGLSQKDWMPLISVEENELQSAWRNLRTDPPVVASVVTEQAETELSKLSAPKPVPGQPEQVSNSIAQKDSVPEQAPDKPLQATKVQRNASVQKDSVPEQALDKPLQAIIVQQAAASNSMAKEKRQQGSEDDACAGHQLFLDRFIAFYNAGSTANLAGLYDANALENKLLGRSNIGKAYAKWFGLTQQRHLQLSQLTAKTKGLHECHISGFYQASFVDAEGRQLSQKGSVQFVLERMADRFQILRLNY